MTQDFMKDRPIYLQLVERICGDVIKGKLQLGDKLPSVREFAIDSGVNVNTVQRVYRELEMMELTETKRGQGTFITTNDEKITHIRENKKKQVTDQFIFSIESLGFSVAEIIEVLQQKGGK